MGEKAELFLIFHCSLNLNIDLFFTAYTKREDGFTVKFVDLRLKDRSKVRNFSEKVLKEKKKQWL